MSLGWEISEVDSRCQSVQSHPYGILLDLIGGRACEPGDIYNLFRSFDIKCSSEQTFIVFRALYRSPLGMIT